MTKKFNLLCNEGWAWKNIPIAAVFYVLVTKVMEVEKGGLCRGQSRRRWHLVWFQFFTFWVYHFVIYFMFRYKGRERLLVQGPIRALLAIGVIRTNCPTPVSPRFASCLNRLKNANFLRLDLFQKLQYTHVWIYSEDFINATRVSIRILQFAYRVCESVFKSYRMYKGTEVQKL